MYHTNFVHLHVHSHYSILDGAAPVKGIVDTARRFRMPAIAITDHGNMFGAIDFYQAALKRGVKPIVGFEAYLAPRSRLDRTGRKDEPNYHLVLLARDYQGYKNLVKLSTRSYTEGFYYKPRIDEELLREYGSGLVGMGACLQGEVPYKLLRGDFKGAREAVRKYQEIFGKEHFFLEVQDHGLPDQKAVLPLLVELGSECEVPLVATNDAHYLNEEDWEAHDALLCLQTRSFLDEKDRFRFGSRHFYLKSPQMMTDLFRDIPEAVTNTLRVAEQCNLQLTLGKSILPHFPIPEGKTPESYLEELCRANLPRRYPNPSPDVLKRLEYELGVIRRMGFCGYFLIVWDVIHQAGNLGVPVGPGRGSAAGSLVSYLLGITDIDPIRYGLLFERFLNPDRISMPDIDLDFSDAGRGRVIDYVVEKYGRGKVSQIITFATILAKLAIRDIGRVMRIPLAEVDRIAKLVPEGPGVHLKKVLQEVPELKEIMEKGTEEQRRLLRIAQTVDGVVRHTGIHAAGIVISRDELMDVVPTFVDQSKEIVTQYEKNAIEKIGLLKMDFLGLKTLSLIQRALDAIKLTRGIDLDLAALTYDDQATFELLGKGLTMGVFQLESSGMRSLVARLKPSVFEDIIALLAIYRPGPLGSGMVDDFVERKHGRTEIRYPHPDLEPILKETYGVFLYQEQCMQTANILAGFTMGQADQLRKAMAKKIAEDMEKMGKLFVEGAVERKVPKEQAQQIFDIMASFGEYGFNKSHSAAYAVVTYRTAFLKAHYPVEFMAAVLSNELGDTDKIAEYIDECHQMGISLLRPDINKSGQFFTVEGKNIRYGLNALKGVGEKAIETILETRQKLGEFKNLPDFTRRVDTQHANARVIESLIKAGAFESFGLKKSQLLAMAPEVLKTGQNIQKEKSAGQSTFFDLFGEEASVVVDSELKPADVPELSNRELLQAEKEAFGFYFSGNPFEEIAPLARLFIDRSIADLGTCGDGDICRICGILTEVKKHSTKKGDIMAFLNLEADNSNVDVTVFPSTYEKVSKHLKVDEPLFMVVRTQMVGADLKVNAERIFSQDDLNAEGFAHLTITVPQEKARKASYQELLKLIRRNPGVSTFHLTINISGGQKVTLKPPARLRTSLVVGVVREIEALFGKGSVSAQFPVMKEIRDRPFRSNFRNGNNGSH